ncbi:LOW QUALITY PROTEIN: protein trichome birefringence-like 4 [Capsicum annuum]|uniref:LOW QUALITY PROTEIN: protein trichome birefringence-like 4 n=1 Tax=Capsicum annuum TaxID=4072 RepID=UPI0007BF0B62|nr:LOW QUALITY PROTEIN: protein trichome birefringence-like 4 [Capsicum annuum]
MALQELSVLPPKVRKILFVKLWNDFTLFFFTLTLLIFVIFFSTSNTSLSVVTTKILASRLHSDSFSSFNHSHRTSSTVLAPINFPRKSWIYAAIEEDTSSSCDIFDGEWIEDNDLQPLYKLGSCPFVDNAFNCFKNGRHDTDYLMLRWKPHGRDIPRFDGLKMLKILRGKRLVFVGDSLNNHMWESLVCALRNSLNDKNKVNEVSGLREFASQGFYPFKFKDFKCSIDFIKSPFLVQEWKFSDKAGARRETLRLDTIHGSLTKYHDADIIIFNTGHRWTHQKTHKLNKYFQEGNHVYDKLEVADAYTKALKTWAHCVDTTINSSRTRVFFRGYSASHFKGGQWNKGGNCDGETKPNEAQLGTDSWMMRVLESVISEMKAPVIYLNITKMTDYRKEGHPSIFREAKSKRKPGMFQDCSHWCLPGVPDFWNQLLYATLLESQ